MRNLLRAIAIAALCSAASSSFAFVGPVSDYPNPAHTPGKAATIEASDVSAEKRTSCRAGIVELLGGIPEDSDLAEVARARELTAV